MDVAAFVVSLVALTVSGAAVLYARREARAVEAANELTERMVAVEEERRDVERESERTEARKARLAELRLAYRGDGSQGWLLVENRGPAEAERVRVEVVASYGAGSMPQVGPIAVDLLAAGDRAEVPVWLTAEEADDVECQVSWRDGDGSHDLVRRRVVLRSS